MDGRIAFLLFFRSNRNSARSPLPPPPCSPSRFPPLMGRRAFLFFLLFFFSPRGECVWCLFFHPPPTLGVESKRPPPPLSFFPRRMREFTPPPLYPFSLTPSDLGECKSGLFFPKPLSPPPREEIPPLSPPSRNKENVVRTALDFFSSCQSLGLFKGMTFPFFFLGERGPGPSSLLAPSVFFFFFPFSP